MSDGAGDLPARPRSRSRGGMPGFLGELGTVALEVWQRVSEAQDRGRGSADVAILFTDLVDFSSWALEVGDREAIALLRRVTHELEMPVYERRGEVVKLLGDGLMAAFDDPRSAVEAAFAAQERVAPIEADGYRARLRTGIHLGRPRRLAGDYLGVDVNIAARLVEAAKPDEVLVSNRTLEGIPRGVVEAKRRRFRAKGTPKGLRVYALTPAAEAAPAGPGTVRASEGER